jgi:hypothetical protein
MKIKIIVLDIPMSPLARRVTQAGLVALVLGAGVAFAAPKHTFKGGDALPATQLNETLADLDTRLQESRLVRNGAGGSYSVGATKLCGTTDSLPLPFTADGKVGYAAAKAYCEKSACNSPSAHMCTAAEVVRSVALGIGPTKEGWYSSGTEGGYSSSGTTASINDCSGWQSNNAASLGMTWQVGSPEQPNRNTPYDRPCNEQHPILCCD